MVPRSVGVAMPMILAYQADVFTSINVYDESNKASPVLTRNFTVSESYHNSQNNSITVHSILATYYTQSQTLKSNLTA